MWSTTMIGSGGFQTRLRGLSYDLGMPCDCVLDLERRWVRGRAWGVVTYADVMAARLKFTSDPNFRPDFCQLYDGREVTRMALTASEIGVLARDDVFGARSRRAFVAPSQETYAMMRLFQTYRSINAGKEAIRMFQTVADAEAWLAAG